MHSMRSGGTASPDAIELRLHADRAAPSSARASAAKLLERLPADRAGDAELLISELVTIAVVHSAEEASDVVLRIADDEATLRVEVRDAGEWFDAERTTPDEAARTWGLRLLDRMADRWGIERREGHTLAWFEIDEGPSLRVIP